MEPNSLVQINSLHRTAMFSIFTYHERRMALISGHQQLLSGFAPLCTTSLMCPSLQVPCILLSPYWHHCMHSFLCLSAERKQNCLLLGFPKHFIWAIQTSSLPALTTGPSNSHIRIQIRLPHSPPELLFTI